MDIREFEKQLNEIRARNGWIFEFECNGIWIVNIYDKETNKLLATTGTTSIAILLDNLEQPFSKLWKVY